MRTLTAYGLGVILVFAVLNFVAWKADNPNRHMISVFSAGFILGAFGMYLAAWLYGYRKIGAY